ncbi:MAG: ribosome biogenesis GTPase Der [Oscillospiraceae bacterium]|nr:ribosome biogenesis GTPase Der [Oscillospiraceae bacterium]
MSKPMIAIVGRPNVGKSMLFNKLIGQRLSIVEDTPGVTRDRIYGESEWCGRKFTLVDTGGIEPNTDNQILAFMREQAQIAIDNATVIVFVTDIKTGMTASDQEVANMLQRSGKPIVLAVNKVDGTGTVDPEIYEFYNLGLGDPIAVSAVHGHGTGDLLDACLQYFPPEDEGEDESDVIQVAIIGKPNVGKSSLTNRILGQERVIVSNVAGTTRDAIDSYFENNFGKYNFIDTAGMRKKSRVEDNIEKYSVLRATMAIERSDVCLILIDAQEGVTEQDTKVAGLAHEAGKACIIVVNKWDLVEKDDKTMDRMREDIRRDLSFMTYAPILFISAATGQRVNRLFELINYVNDQSATRITTGMLNSVLADAQTRVQPPTDKGRRLKIYYMTQVGVKPPHFVVFCNDKQLFHFSYKRYLENQIRGVFGLEGTPIIMSIRQKGEEE